MNKLFLKDATITLKMWVHARSPLIGCMVVYWMNEWVNEYCVLNELELNESVDDF